MINMSQNKVSILLNNQDKTFSFEIFHEIFGIENGDENWDIFVELGQDIALLWRTLNKICRVQLSAWLNDNQGWI